MESLLRNVNNVKSESESSSGSSDTGSSNSESDSGTDTESRKKKKKRKKEKKKVSSSKRRSKGYKASLDDLVESQYIGYYSRDEFKNQGSSISQSINANHAKLQTIRKEGHRLYEEYMLQAREAEWLKISTGKPKMKKFRHGEETQEWRTVRQRFSMPAIVLHLGSSNVLTYNGGETCYMLRFFLRKKDNNQWLETAKLDAFSIQIPVRILHGLRAANDFLIGICEESLTTAGKGDDCSIQAPLANEL